MEANQFIRNIRIKRKNKKRASKALKINKMSITDLRGAMLS